MSDDLERLAADLAGAGKVSRKAVQAVVAKGALNVKDGWRERASGLAHAPLYPNAITYELTPRAGSIEAEIGPDKDKRQGALGNLLEFGSPTSGPHNHGGQALDAEEPRFITALEQIAGEVLR